MASISDRLAAARERHPVLDHVLCMQEHYSGVKANQQAGGVTYFAFLSFFPILALAVFVVGVVSRVYPGVNADLVGAINEVLPGVVGSKEGQVSLDDIRTFSGWAAVIGLAGVLYSGLAWMSALRDALFVVFEKPDFRQPSFVVGKLRDLLTLATLGVTLLVSVAATGFVRGFSDEVLAFLNLDSTLGWLVEVATIALGLAVNARAVLPDLPAAGQPRTPAPVAVGGRGAGRRGLRAAQGAVPVPAAVHQGPAGLPGLRHRAGPRRVDQLLLAGDPVRRVLGLVDRRGARRTAADGRPARAGPAVAVAGRAPGPGRRRVR